MTGARPPLPNETVRPTTGIRLAGLARAGYGLALLCAPGLLIGVATGRPPSRRAKAVARLLGARHLAQAAVCGAIPARGLLVAGAAADGLHAASMLALARADARVRRAVLADAGIEALFAASTAAALSARG
jgi:hypothetical protein